MLLRKYLKAVGRGEISRLVRETGCAGSTFHDILNGKPVARYATAKRISDATGGAVSVADLCGPQPARSRSPERARRERGRSDLRRNGGA